MKSTTQASGLKELTMPDSKANALSSYLEKCNFPPPGTSVSCAVSGGADSSALAVLAKAADLKIHLLYVDHGLRPDSHKDSEKVEALAKTLDSNFQHLKVEVKKGGNLEANARKVRYEALDAIDPNTLLGHTADDQAETLLLNLLWGSGPEGLAGMRRNQRRPILNLRRADTEAICDLVGITPINDPMNVDPAFRRSRIRYELIPLLNEIAEKDVVPVLTRTTDILRQNSEFLNALTQDIDPTDARALQKLDPYLATWVIKRWLSETCQTDAAAIERVLSVARGETLATEIPGGYRVSRSSMRLKIES